jgi:tyrosine-protein kinase Etk/Wzc
LEPLGVRPGPAAQGRSPADYLSVVLRFKFLILGFAAAAAALAVAFGLRLDPRFEAEARIRLEDSAAGGGLLGELALMNQAPPAEAEIEVLRSRALAERVTADPAGPESLGLGLSVRVDDIDRFWSWPGLKRALFGGAAPTGNLAVRTAAPPRGTSVFFVEFLAADRVRLETEKVLGGSVAEYELAPGRPLSFLGNEFHLVPDGELTGRTFRVHLTDPRTAAENLKNNLQAAETQRGSGVIRLVFSDRHPQRAAETLNRLVRAYIEKNRERISLRAGTTVAFIQQEIGRIQGELAEAEAELVAFQEGSGAAMLSEVASALIDRASSLDLERAGLALEIVNQERLLDLMLDPAVDVEDVAAGVQNDPVVTAMLQTLAALVAREGALALEYTDEWPELAEVRSEILDYRRRIRANLKSRAEALRSRDELIAEQIEEMQGDLDRLPASERDLARFQRKASSFEQIYTYLLGQLQEAKIAEAGAIAAVDVIDWAVPPNSRSYPNLSLSGALGLAAGLFLGLLTALYFESATRKVLSAAQLEEVTGLTSFGAIPDFRRGATRSKGVGRSKWFLALRDAPNSPAAEAYRSLRANLRFAAKGRELKSLAITSSGQGEGKSVTTLDLAIALANGGAKVVVVDADLRRPVVHKHFAMDISPGLSQVLQDELPWREAVKQNGVVGLEVITAGKVSGQPGDLLASRAMAGLVKELGQAYDFVLFDVPPVLAVADAAGFLHELDGIFLLCRYDQAPEAVVAGAARRLQTTGANLLGSILNGIRHSRLASYGKYGYGYGYGYGYEYAPDEADREHAG